MTKQTSEALLALKARLGIRNNDDDELLVALVDSARHYILSYTNRTQEEWEDSFFGAMVAIAAIEFSRMGAEGYVRRVEGAVTTWFAEGYPSHITKLLDPKRIVKGFC